MIYEKITIIINKALQLQPFRRGVSIMMKPNVRTGIIGAGMMGVQHVEAIRRVPGIEIVALADPDYHMARKTCETLCIPSAYDDYSVMIASERLDAVHVCSPNFTHYSISKAALLAGLHVFCEKPLAGSAAETEELAALAGERGLIAAVDFNYRQNVIVREMRALLEDASWGKTFLIRGEYLQDWMMYDTDYNWRCIPEVNGASRAIADIGSHWFDAVQYITGKRVVRLYAKNITIHQQRKKYQQQAKTFEKQAGDAYQLIDIESEDAAFILFEMEDGVPGVLTVSQVSAGYKNSMVISLDGSNRSLTWEQESPDKLLIRTREDGTTARLAAAGAMHGAANAYTTLPAGHAEGWADGLKNSVNAFYEALKGRRDAGFATFSEGNDIVRIVEACLLSADKNAWVDVERKEIL